MSISSEIRIDGGNLSHTIKIMFKTQGRQSKGQHKIDDHQEHRDKQALVRPSPAAPLREANCVPECPQGPAIPSHNPLDQVKTIELELDEAVVEVKQYKGFGEFDKVDEEIAKNTQDKEADETKLNAEYTLTTNTGVKNKIPN